MKKTFAAAAAAALVAAMSAGALAAGNVTMEQAKETALNRAGVTAGEVRFTKAHPDTDDGRRTYEFEFWKGNTEYDVEIDAATGRVRDYDVDYHRNGFGGSEFDGFFGHDDDDRDFDDFFGRDDDRDFDDFFDD